MASSKASWARWAPVWALGLALVAVVGVLVWLSAWDGSGAPAPVAEEQFQERFVLKEQVKVPPAESVSAGNATSSAEEEMVELVMNYVPVLLAVAAFVMGLNSILQLIR